MTAGFHTLHHPLCFLTSKMLCVPINQPKSCIYRHSLFTIHYCLCPRSKLSITLRNKTIHLSVLQLMQLRLIYISMLLCFTGLTASAQTSNLRTKSIPATGTVVLDSLSIVPNTLYIRDIDTTFYAIDYVNAVLSWKKAAPGTFVTVTYRVFPLRFNKPVFRFSYDSVVGRFHAPAAVNRGGGADNTVFNFGNFTYNGSFGRSLSFGNSQDAVFNSQLNLQLNGYIGDSIEVAAAITDNNIPIQPDGTTQQLNEFDRILLQFRKTNWELNLGDIDLRQNNLYFLNFYKRLQGLSYMQKWNAGTRVKNESLVSGAIAKGKFTRYIFMGQEGNQGPYRLQGANNEFFFIVLAGTERVFLDGEMLQRGEDQDYVINYNTAEIIFTPRRMITKDRRIQVEFENADRNYLNSMLYANHATKLGNKLTVRVGAYANTDAKNSPINQSLNDQQKQFLSNIGDSIANAFYPSFALDTFSAGKILYKRIELPTGDSIFVYSTHPDSARYSLNFLFVGDNRGNYIPFFNGANGKVYQYVAPVNGVPQGSFEPAVFLVTPKQHQVYSIATEYAIDNNTIIRTDLGLSNYNVNRFSSKNKSDDVGFAGRFHLLQNRQLRASAKQYNLSWFTAYEWIDKNFKPVERLRSVEFGRDWGLNFVPAPATEHLPSAGIAITDEKNNKLQYDFTAYLRSDEYNGYRHTVAHKQMFGQFTTDNLLNLTFINTPADKGYFLRPALQLSRQFPQLKNHTVGTSYALEHQEIRHRSSDTITPASFSFQTISAFVRSDVSKLNKWAFTYFTRQDKYPLARDLVVGDKSNNYNLQAEIFANPRHQFRFNATYRELFVFNNTLSRQKRDNSVLGRVEYLINEWKGLVHGSVLYELGAGQEPRRDFSYFEVPAGRGEYAWNDYNNDGIPQLNEFEIALFSDQAKFIRIFTPTNQFVKANYTQFNYNITLNPRAAFKQITNAAEFITRFLLQSSLQTGKKEISTGAASFNPFKSELQDTSLVQLNSTFSNTLSFNRFSSKWGIDFTNVRNYAKALLTYGLETRELNDWILRARLNFFSAYTVELVQKFTTNNLYTPAFANRNYQITSVQTEPRLSYTWQTKIRLLTSYQLIHKKNAGIYGGEKSINHIFNLEGKYNILQSMNLNAKFSYHRINYSGNTNTTVSYILLEGLLPGSNTLWNIDFTKRLLNNLELNFQYEGRKPSQANTIHIGRASIRAIL